jgi:hypothetical protein
MKSGNLLVTGTALSFSLRFISFGFVNIGHKTGSFKGIKTIDKTYPATA